MDTLFNLPVQYHVSTVMNSAIAKCVMFKFSCHCQTLFYLICECLKRRTGPKCYNVLWANLPNTVKKMYCHLHYICSQQTKYANIRRGLYVVCCQWSLHATWHDVSCRFVEVECLTAICPSFHWTLSKIVWTSSWESLTNLFHHEHNRVRWYQLSKYPSYTEI